MLRILSWLALLPFIVLAVTVAIFNRHAIELRFDPLAQFDLAHRLELPVYLVLFASILVGLLLGSLTMWVQQRKWRVRAARQTRHVQRLEKKLAQFERASSTDRLTLRP
ncbi:MAG: LapA family protein [Alphaproteobacteria bacterium]